MRRKIATGHHGSVCANSLFCAGGTLHRQPPRAKLSSAIAFNRSDHSLPNFATPAATSWCTLSSFSLGIFTSFERQLLIVYFPRKRVKLPPSLILSRRLPVR